MEDKGEAATTSTLKAIDPNVIQLVDINELSDIFTGFDERYALEPFTGMTTIRAILYHEGFFSSFSVAQTRILTF